MENKIESCGHSAEEANEIAKTIRDQLGGGRALVFSISANTFSSSNDEGRGALSFRFKGSRKANHVKIILTVMDTYTLRFTKVGKFDFKTVETVEDVYNDQLTDVFRRVTGLETRLPRIIGINA